MAVKDFIDEALTKGHIVALVSLDVKGAFDAEWWPSILKALKDFQCSRNLFKLTRNYFSDRSAFISSNSMSIEKSSKQRLSPRVLQWTRVLEYLL
jgi:hypothetical protein